MLNGLYDAKLDHAPVVAIVGQQARMSLGASYQQEVDLPALFKDVAHEYAEVCMDPRQAGHLIDNNRDLNQVTWEQRVMAGEAKLPASQRSTAATRTAAASSARRSRASSPSS